MLYYTGSPERRGEAIQTIASDIMSKHKQYGTPVMEILVCSLLASLAEAFKTGQSSDYIISVTEDFFAIYHVILMKTNAPSNV